MKKLANIAFATLVIACAPAYTFGQTFFDNFSGAALGVDTGSFTDTAVNAYSASWAVVPSDPASIDLIYDLSPFLPDDSANIGYDPGNSNSQAGISLNLADVGITAGTYELSMDISAGQVSDQIGYSLSSSGYFLTPTYIPLDGLNYSGDHFDTMVTVGPNSDLTILTTDSNTSEGATTDVAVSNISLVRQPTPEPLTTGLALGAAILGLMSLKRARSL